MKSFTPRERNGLIALACVVTLCLAAEPLSRVAGCRRADALPVVVTDSGRAVGTDTLKRVDNRSDNGDEKRIGKEDKRGRSANVKGNKKAGKSEEVKGGNKSNKSNSRKKRKGSNKSNKEKKDPQRRSLRDEKV